MGVRYLTALKENGSNKKDKRLQASEKEKEEMSWLDNFGFWYEIGIFVLIAIVFLILFFIIPRNKNKKKQVRYTISRKTMDRIKRGNQ